MNTKRKTARSGFTLIELLAVVVIIGILLGLVAAVAVQALTTADNAVIASDIKTLELGMKAVEQQLRGSGPPPSNQADAIAWLKGGYPMWAGTDLNGFTVTPETAIVFWLQGPSGKGFSSNPENPFDYSNPDTCSPIGELDQGRIRNNRYYQHTYNDGDDPFVYFSSNSTGGYTNQSATSAAGHQVKPVTLQNGNYANSGTYQIRAPGMDGKLGDCTQLPLDGTPPAEGTVDYNIDDISNVTGGKTFEKYSAAQQ